MFGTNFPNFSTLLSDPSMIDSSNKDLPSPPTPQKRHVFSLPKKVCFFTTTNLHRKKNPPGFQLKLHSSKGHGHVQNTQHRWKPPGLQRPKKWAKVIKQNMWVEISHSKHRSKWEAINIFHHLDSREFFFMCQFKSSCQCAKSKALQGDLCWQSEDILFLSLCKLRFPEGITKPPLALKLQLAKFCNMSTTVCIHVLTGGFRPVKQVGLASCLN